VLRPVTAAAHHAHHSGPWRHSHNHAERHHAAFQGVVIGIDQVGAGCVRSVLLTPLVAQDKASCGALARCKLMYLPWQAYSDFCSPVLCDFSRFCRNSIPYLSLSAYNSWIAACSRHIPSISSCQRILTEPVSLLLHPSPPLPSICPAAADEHAGGGVQEPQDARVQPLPV
jgi:hypothetical protein